MRIDRDSAPEHLGPVFHAGTAWNRRFPGGKITACNVSNRGLFGSSVSSTIPRRRLFLPTEGSKRAQDTEELETIITDLRAALKEHTEKVRKLAAARLTEPMRRKTD